MKTRKMKPYFGTQFLAAIAMCAAVGNANSASYSFTPLNSLGGQFGYAQATGINSAGQISGYSSSGGLGSDIHAVVWNGNTPAALSPMGTTSYAYGINDSGQVVGSSFLNSNGPGALQTTVWQGGVATAFGSMSDGISYGRAINNLGQIAGVVLPNGSGNMATLWNGSVPTALGTGDGVQSYGWAVNSSGQVAGSTDGSAALWSGSVYTNLGQGNAFGINDFGQVVGSRGELVATIWTQSTSTDLGSLGGDASSAYDINNRGQVVGFSYTSDNSAQHAALWMNGVVIDLNSFLDAASVNAGWVLIEAVSINESGSIVGNARDAYGTPRAFLLSEITAVPEPASAALMACGLAIVALLRRRRRG